MRALLVVGLSLACVAERSGLRTLDYALLRAKAPCPHRFVPRAGAKGKAQFHALTGRQGCCVLDKAIAAMELKYAMSNCVGFRATVAKHDASDYGSGKEGVMSPCFSGAVKLLGRDLAACCPAHAAQCRAAIAQPLHLLGSSLEPHFRQCVSVENELQDAHDTTCNHAAHASVRVIGALLSAAATLYKHSPADVTPASATMLTLCADVQDCSSRIRVFLSGQLGHAKLVVPAHPEWVSNPSGCSQDVKLNCGFFECPTVTGASCAATVPRHHAVVIGRGEQTLAGTGDIRVPNAVQAALHFDAPHWSFTAWVKTSKPGTIVSMVSSSQPWATPAHGANKALVISHDLKLQWTGSGSVLTKVVAKSKSVVGDGKWHSVAVTYSSDLTGAAGGLSLWVDGKREVGPLAVVLPADATGALVRVGFAAPDSGAYFAGTLGDLIYWKTALDTEKIAQEAGGQPGGNRECFCGVRQCAVPLKHGGAVKYHCVHRD